MAASSAKDTVPTSEKSRDTDTGDLATHDAEVIVTPSRVPNEVEARARVIEAGLSHALLADESFADEVGALIRQAVDYVIDAPTMRRYSISELEPDEKTTIGKRIERLLRMRLKLDRGEKLDILVEGEEVDIKTSCTKSRSWMFSRRNVGHFNLLIAYDEDVAEYDLGLVYVTEDILGADNRDKKRGMTGDKGQRTGEGVTGKAQAVSGSISWLVRHHPYEPNFLAWLDQGTLSAVTREKFGTRRVQALLRHVTGVPIPRHAIASVANQKDPKRRDRGGKGGARVPLWGEGLLVLSGTYKQDSEIALAVTGSELARDETLVINVADERLTSEQVETYRQAHRLT